MGDLYFIEYPGMLTYIYSRREDGTWRMSRIAPCQNKKLVWVLLYNQEKASWVVQDQTPGNKNDILGRPVVPAGESQSPDSPPLGAWRFAGYQCKVTDCMPIHPGLDPLPAIDVPFATMRYTEKGNIARLDTKVNSTAITDEALEELLRQLAIVVKNLATRPAMVLVLHSDGNDATMPSFSQIRRFLAWIQENGPELFLVGRGSAIVLRPRGLISHALVNIVRMVQRLLPPPWPEAIVNSSEEAEAFLELHSRQYREEGERFNQQLVNGAFSEAELNSKMGHATSDGSSGIGDRFLKAKLESILPKRDRASTAPTSKTSTSEAPTTRKRSTSEPLLGSSLSASQADKSGRSSLPTSQGNYDVLGNLKRTSTTSCTDMPGLGEVPGEPKPQDIAMEGRRQPVRNMALFERGGASRLEDGRTRCW